MTVSRALVAVLILLVAACSQSDYSYMREGEPFATSLVQDVTKDWSSDKLVAQADPRMLKVFPESEIKKMLAQCAEGLGPVKRQETLAGRVSVETAIPGKTVLYTIDVEGEKANGRITVKLQKLDGEWKVLGFWIQRQKSTADK